MPRARARRVGASDRFPADHRRTWEIAARLGHPVVTQARAGGKESKMKLLSGGRAHACGFGPGPVAGPAAPWLVRAGR